MTPDSRDEPTIRRPHITPRTAFWFALSIWALTLAAYGGALIYNRLYPLPPALAAGPGSAANSAVGVVFIGGFATVGALLIWKRSANPIGWLMAATGASYALAGSGGILLLHFPQTRAWGHQLAGCTFSALSSRCSCCCSSRLVRCPRAAGGR